MATSAYRLLAILITLNIVIVFAGMYYGGYYGDGGDNEKSTLLQNWRNFSNDLESGFESTNPDLATTYLDKNYGDQQTLGKGFWTVFKGRITFEGNCGDTSAQCPYIEQQIDWGLNLVFWIINLMGVMTVFFIIFNKKND